MPSGWKGRRGALGRALPRVEGAAKVTGASTYTADVVCPGALRGGFLRSPYPHARILNVDASRALRLPGVEAVITGNDVSPRLEGLGLEDMPVLARDRVRYVGEKVAGIAATDQETVEEALGLIEVDYEELPGVFDPFVAMEPGAPILHPDYAAYRGMHKAPELQNVQSVERAEKGDVERGFGECHEIFENTFHIPMVHQSFLEPRAGLLAVDEHGCIGVWHCHQAPFMVRSKLAAHLDVPEERIVVHPVSTGGSFGGKLGYDDILCAYYLARAAGCPVRIQESYSQELLDGQPRHAAVVTLRTGVKRGGRFWAWDGRVVYNGGAYAARTPRNGLNGTFLLAGCYRTPHVRMAGLSVYTNQVPAGFFRAPGEVQTLFAVESHVDMMAEALKIDPLSLREINALREGDTKPTDEPLRDARALDVLREVARAAGWRRGRAAHKAGGGARIARGRGMALGFRHIGTGESSAELFLEKGGVLRLATAVRDVGVGAHTMHRQVAAEMLGVEADRVQIDVKGTDTGTYDEGVRGQRGTYVEGQAVARAADSLMQALRKQAAAFWGVEVERVRWQGGRAHRRGSPRQFLNLEGLSRLSGNGPLRGFGHCKGGRPEIYVFQAMVAEVEVDRETGQVRVCRLYFTLDASKIINPLIHQGQIEGAIVQGTGQSLMEHLVAEEGRVLTLSHADYKIPTIMDVPALSTSQVVVREGPGPFGTKPVAESGIGIVAPAIANAVYNATGARIMELPLSSEKVFAKFRPLTSTP